METEKLITSKSPTIGVREIRNLMELTNTMGKVLTYEEYTRIAIVYNAAIERLLKENGESV